MEIETYDNNDNGAVKVFFVLKNNQVTSVKVGNKIVPTEKGFQFYVDKVVANQIDKVELLLDDGKPSIVLKDGEQIEVPEMTDKEKRIEQLKKELEELENAE